MSMDELEILKKLPWKKLLVSNGMAGICGAIVLVFYFHGFVFSREDGTNLQTQVDRIEANVQALTLHLIPSHESSKTERTRLYRNEETAKHHKPSGSHDESSQTEQSESPLIFGRESTADLLERIRIFGRSSTRVN